MNLALELRNELRGMITKVEDIKDLFPKYKEDKLLNGIFTQATFLVEIIEHGTLYVYSYWKYIHEINNKEVGDQEGGKMAEGRLLATKFAHLMIDMDEVFKRFPTDQQIADKSEEIAMVESGSGGRFS